MDGSKQQRWGRWSASLRARIEEGIRHRVTPLGAMMLVLFFASGVLAFATGQNVFFLLFSLLLASILISSFINRLMLAGLEIKADLPEHACAGEPVHGALELNNTKAWVATFGLSIKGDGANELQVPVLQGRAFVPWTWEFPRRGKPGPATFELATRFPFGFSVRRVRVRVDFDRTILPPIAEADGFREILESLAAQADAARRLAGPEFSHLRDYVPGDSLRRIAWPATARRQAPVVREHEEESEGHLLLAIDRGSPDFERLVHLAAYLVWELALRRIPFVFETDVPVRVEEERDAYRVLSWLALVQPDPASPAAPGDGRLLTWRNSN